MINPKHLVYLAVPMLMLLACNNPEQEEVNTQSIRPVRYTKIASSSLEGKHSYTGIAKAQQEASLSFKVGGTINKISVKVGDRVKRGKTLASLDATDYQVSYSQSLASAESSKAQIESAQAQMQSAKANYQNAESNYKRFEKLYETNSISISEFEQAKSAYQGAEASYNAAKTQVEAAKAGEKSSQSVVRSASNQVSYTKITAPFDGIITRINVEPNELVGQGNPVMEINSLGNPNVEIGVPENAISEIKSGQQVVVTFNSLHHHSFSGLVDEIGYSSAGTTYPVTVRLTDSDERIRPGMPANATFTYSDHDSVKSALLVPPSAVGQDENGNFVYQIQGTSDDYVCRKMTVKVGKLTDAGFEVISGLKSGDLVASAGLNVLRDGMQVSLYQQK